MVWYAPLFQNFPQLIVIHTVKGFGIVKKAEIDVFLELSCFFHDPVDVGHLISGSSAFSKTSLNIWKFTIHVLLKEAQSGIKIARRNINNLRYADDTALMAESEEKHREEEIKLSLFTGDITVYVVVVTVQSPVKSDSLQPHGLQCVRPPCPSPSPGVCPDSSSLHQ